MAAGDTITVTFSFLGCLLSELNKELASMSNQELWQGASILRKLRP